MVKTLKHLKHGGRVPQRAVSFIAFTFTDHSRDTLCICQNNIIHIQLTIFKQTMTNHSY